MSKSDSRVNQNGRTLVLDLDETLACSQQNPNLEQYQIYTDPSIFSKFHPPGQKQICFSTTVPHSGSDLKIWGIKRPGLEEFLRFAQDYFENVIIWSAGVENYVKGICEEIFDDPEGKLRMPRVIWARDRCAPGNNFYHKPLNVLAGTFQDSHIKIDLKSKTLILDDREYTFTANPENGVLIPAFKPSGGVHELSKPFLITIFRSLQPGCLVLKS